MRCFRRLSRVLRCATPPASSGAPVTEREHTAFLAVGARRAGPRCGGHLSQRPSRRAPALAAAAGRLGTRRRTTAFGAFPHPTLVRQLSIPRLDPPTEAARQWKVTFRSDRELEQAGVTAASK